ncbi:solute carrier family 2, facilitated glucose transporter member 6 [Lepeophtheirus salmonis]|uniref:Major facilitator superfamily (MFS) profile domain-containing protein n=1 Tax=Lepeophtheirus salmonis TaxID=72036 RepID=A0A0K2TXR8_LEPSM|nr:solute carrier family 2, facilitated glucose transporter member 6-like [Lepeophtheirus salmonis]
MVIIVYEASIPRVDKPLEILRPFGNVRRQMAVGVVANIVSMTGAIALISSSMILPQLQGESRDSINELTLTMEEGSWFASLFSIGFIFGSIVGGFQSDYFGRKLSMMIDCAVMSTGFFCMAFSTSFPMLLFGRFIGGHATSSSLASLPIYIGEISHPHMRGTIAGMFGLLYYFGTLVVSISSGLLSWRITMGIMGCVPIINFFGFIFCPESPTWLIRRNKTAEAFKSLMFLRGERAQVLDAIKKIENNLNTEIEAHEFECKKTLLVKLRQYWNDLIHPTFVKPFVILLFFIAFVQVWTGTTFINFYMITFFQNMDLPIDPYLISAFLSLFRMILGIFGVSIIGSVKRRTVYITLSAFIFVANSSLALHQFLMHNGYFQAWGIHEYQVICLFPLFSVALLFGSYAIGFGTISRTLQGELLPADKRSFGVGIIGFVEGISIFVIAKISPFMLQNFKMYGCFGIFACVSVSAVLIAYFFLPETKDQSLEDIENHYQNISGIKNKENNI